MALRVCNFKSNKTVRRGRPRKQRILSEKSQYRCFQPCCRPDEEGRVNVIEPEELEALRLVDVLNYDQESAAEQLGISRKTLWRDLHTGRKKVVEALIEGKRLEIAGCSDSEKEECYRRKGECAYIKTGPEKNFDLK